MTTTSSKALDYQKSEKPPDTRQAFIDAYAPKQKPRWNLIAWVVDARRRMAAERFEKASRPVAPQEDTLDRDPYIKELSDHYEIRLDLTGIYLDRVDYRLGSKNITISGTWSLEKKNEKVAGSSAPVRPGPFFKIVKVPSNADGNHLYIEQEGNELVAIMPKIYRKK